MAAHPAAEGKGDDRGGTSRRGVNAERSTDCSVLVTWPASLRWPHPAHPGYEVAHHVQPCASRPADPGGDVPGSAPWRADRGIRQRLQDSDHGHQKRRPYLVMCAGLCRGRKQPPWIMGGAAMLAPGFTRSWLLSHGLRVKPPTRPICSAPPTALRCRTEPPSAP